MFRTLQRIRHWIMACVTISIALLISGPAVSDDKTPAVCQDFGYLLMSQVWAPTECKREPQLNNCGSLNKVARWVVHGLWPDYNTPGTYPSFCQPPSYSDSENAAIATELAQKWPNLIFVPTDKTATDKDAITNRGLWKHEWNKHGTCAELCDKAITSQKQYFQLSLDLFDRFDVGGVLTAAGITPDDTREVSGSDVLKAIELSTGSVPQLACFNDTATKKSYLLEMRICLKSNARDVFDCPASNDADSACPASFIIPEKL